MAQRLQLVEPWSEAEIIRALIHSPLFQRKLIAIPHTYWAGDEADLLFAHSSRRLIDVEVKISKADLLADPKKDKWRTLRGEQLEWPRKIWKHYYCMPAPVWRASADRISELPARSGVLLLSLNRTTGAPIVSVARRAQANKAALQLSSDDVLDLARHAGLRMWDAILANQRPRRRES